MDCTSLFRKIGEWTNWKEQDVDNLGPDFGSPQMACTRAENEYWERMDKL